MRTTLPGPLARAAALVALVASMLSIQAEALDFSVDSLNCTELAWIATLTQTEWSVASYVNLFFVATAGANNYSLLYSALSGGEFPTPGSYRKLTAFGNTTLRGTYRIGIGLADINGNLLTTTSTSSGIVQVTALDSRSFTFNDCDITSSATSTSSSASSRPTSSSASIAPSATSASSRSSQTASSTSASAAPASSLAAAATSSSANMHHVNKGAIAGGVIGGVVLLLIAVALARWCASRRRTRRLSLAAHRMSDMRSPSLSEKTSRSPKDDGSESPNSRRMTAKVYASADTLEIAALSRLSSSSRRRSASNGDDLSLSNILAQGPSRGEEEEPEEIRVIKVPFHLTPGQQVAPPHDSVALESFAPASSTYLPLSRTASVPVHAPVDPFQSHEPSTVAGPAESSHTRSKSTPLAIHPASTTSPQTSPTAPSFTAKGLRSPQSQNFKIPRVSVPAYLAGVESTQDSEGLAEAMDRQMSTDSIVRRFSTGAATFVSVEEDPFVDAAQETNAPSELHASSSF